MPTVYEEVYSYMYGYALVKSNEKWGFIDRFGKISVDLEFDDINGKNEWLTPVKYGNKWGYVTRNNRGHIHSYYDCAYPFKDDLAIVQANGKWGYIDKRNHPHEELEEMSKHFKYNTIEEIESVVVAIIANRNVAG